MNLYKKVIKVIRNPREIGRSFMEHTAKFWVNDRLYLELLFYFKLGYVLDLDKPRTFNEKLQWLKLYNRNPLYTQMVDKYLVKEIVANKIGSRFVIKTLALWDKPEDINWESLPNEFVLKTTSGGGCSGVVICKDKSILDKNEVVEKLNRSINSSIYVLSREWPYKNLKPKVLAEQLLKDSDGRDILDYKFYCFDGVPRVMLIASERFKSPHAYFDYYDMQGNHLPFCQGGLNNPITPEVPNNFEELKKVASLLSAGLPHVRLDLYSVNGEVYFGEYTFFDSCGFEAFNPFEWDVIMGDFLNLPKQKLV